MRTRSFDAKTVSNEPYGEGDHLRPHETVLDFHSLDDLVKHVDESERTWGGYNRYLPSRDLIVHGTGALFNQDRSVGQSLDKARYGWKEGRDRLMEWYARLEHEWRKRISSDTFMNDVSGFQVDVPAYLTGVPEQMVSLLPGQARSKSVEVTVDLNVRCSACGRRHHDVSPTDPNWVLVRGAAVTMLTKALIRAGYKPKLTVRTTSHYQMDSVLSGSGVSRDSTASIHRLLTTNVQIMEPGEVFDLDRVNFVLSHDSMVRRLMWRAEENWMLDQRGGAFPKWRDREEQNTVGYLDLRQAHLPRYKSNLGDGEIHVPSIPEIEDAQYWFRSNRKKPSSRDYNKMRTPEDQQAYDRMRSRQAAFTDEETAITWVFDELERCGVRFE